MQLLGIGNIQALGAFYISTEYMAAGFHITLLMRRELYSTIHGGGVSIECRLQSLSKDICSIQYWDWSETRTMEIRHRQKLQHRGQLAWRHFKIYQFWQPTAVAAVGHGGWANSHGPPRAWRLAAVAHSGRGCATAVAYGGRSPLLYKSWTLARKCHKKSEKKKERVEKEKRVRGRSSEALPVLHFIGKYFVDSNPFSTYT
jgi:hypothetical protein